jgi:hypothetical protein
MFVIYADTTLLPYRFTDEEEADHVAYLLNEYTNRGHTVVFMSTCDKE